MYLFVPGCTGMYHIENPVLPCTVLYSPVGIVTVEILCCLVLSCYVLYPYGKSGTDLYSHVPSCSRTCTCTGNLVLTCTALYISNLQILYLSVQPCTKTTNLALTCNDLYLPVPNREIMHWLVLPCTSTYQKVQVRTNMPYLVQVHRILDADAAVQYRSYVDHDILVDVKNIDSL